MFGLILGTLCLIALVATVKRRRHAYYGGYSYRGYGPRFCRHDDYRDVHDEFREYAEPRGYGRRGTRRRDLLRGLFIRLDTTPGQEKAILAIVEDAQRQMREERRALIDLRRELSAVIGSDLLDRAALDGQLALVRDRLDVVGGQAIDALAAIHDVLDTRQRRVLGELIADGSIDGCVG